MTARPLLAAALLAVLATAACQQRPPTAPDQNTPQHQACRRESLTAPTVRALDRRENPQWNAFWPDPLNSERMRAENAAYRACLVRNGLALPGGVETVLPRDRWD